MLNLSLDEFVAQIEHIKRLGSTTGLLSRIPGMEGDVESRMERMLAIYNSMNKIERKMPDILDDYRCQRIAHGAGVDVDEVSGFTNQFYRFKKMMRGIGGP